MGVSPGYGWKIGSGAEQPVAIEVLRRGPVSRAEIGRRLGLSHASLSRLSAPLIERGVIIDVGERSDGTVGRPSRLLDVDASAFYFMGVKLRENELVAVVTNLRGVVQEDRTITFSDPAVSTVIEAIESVYSSLQTRYVISGIGIGLGGAVVDHRTVRSSQLLNWRDVPLSQLVEDATGVPTLVENDIVSLCKYEDWFGAAKSDDRFAVISLGIGTGFGFVVDGKPIVNDEYGIGLVGHWPMDPLGPLCEQGHRGCAAALLNSDSIAHAASMTLGQDVTFDEVIALAEQENPVAWRLVHDAARGLGVLLAAVCNLILPQRVIIAGEGVQLAKIGESEMRTSATSLRAPGLSLPVLDFASGDNVDWAQGAAALVIQEFALGKLKNVKASA